MADNKLEGGVEPASGALADLQTETPLIPVPVVAMKASANENANNLVAELTSKLSEEGEQAKSPLALEVDTKLEPAPGAQPSSAPVICTGKWFKPHGKERGQYVYKAHAPLTYGQDKQATSFTVQGVGSRRRDSDVANPIEVGWALHNPDHINDGKDMLLVGIVSTMATNWTASTMTCLAIKKEKGENDSLVSMPCVAAQRLELKFLTAEERLAAFKRAEPLIARYTKDLQQTQTEAEIAFNEKRALAKQKGPKVVAVKQTKGGKASGKKEAAEKEQRDLLRVFTQKQLVSACKEYGVSTRGCKLKKEYITALRKAKVSHNTIAALLSEDSESDNADGAVPEAEQVRVLKEELAALRKQLSDSTKPASSPGAESNPKKRKTTADAEADHEELKRLQYYVNRTSAHPATSTTSSYGAYDNPHVPRYPFPATSPAPLPYWDTPYAGFPNNPFYQTPANPYFGVSNYNPLAGRPPFF